MSPQRRTALVSVGAAVALMTVKLATGLASGSLGLVSEALHSGTDLVAALLTFLAIGYAVRPADTSHPYGHGKAEHLAALAEAGVLLLVSLLVGGLAVARLLGWIEIDTSTAWWVFAAIAVVIAIDVSRTVVSIRAAQRFSSPALASNALHFGSDLAGTFAVLLGLIAVRAGWPAGDSVAALFVAFLVVVAALRLIRRNVDVLMDRAPPEAVRIASEAIATLDPPVEVKRLRLRQAAGRTFTDVVIGVPPGVAVGQGHAMADRVEEAVEEALPGSDVVVHVEPERIESALRERAQEAAMSVSRVREIHNLAVIELPDGFHVTLHLKLPGDLPLGEAHEVAEAVERAIVTGVPGVVDVQTHLEPLAEQAAGREEVDDPHAIRALVLAETGEEPRALRFLRTDEGVVVLLTLALQPSLTLADAHATASRVEEGIREVVPDVAEVIVHTEP